MNSASRGRNARRSISLPAALAPDVEVDRNGCFSGSGQILLYGSSIEVFVGEGEKAMTMVIPTQISADAISFEAKGGAIADVTFHELAH